ncbi:hypothetical protein [Streptomyces arenae]|uniref:hypothetical protein n=1 Tax=Streptomyces arenae TaxID=29301 RepID=UPI002659EF4C|nr:hypothetical protein [Streptomyces arenae]MCG7203522.1 hypothetical protein [Streptomyces arenae]
MTGQDRVGQDRARQGWVGQAAELFTTAAHHLDEAESVAETCGADAVSGWITQARSVIRQDRLGTP